MSIISHRFYTVIAIAIAVIIAGFLIEWLLSLPRGGAFGHTQAGHNTGWAGLLIILTVFGYSLKKRYGKTGWPRVWFWLHQIAGIIGPLIILVHSGLHFHAMVPLLAMLAMWAVVISGVTGVFVHRKAILLLKDSRQTLIEQGLSQAQIDDKLSELAAGEKAFRIWQHIHAPMVILFVTLTIAHVAGVLYLGGL